MTGDEDGVVRVRMRASAAFAADRRGSRGGSRPAMTYVVRAPFRGIRGGVLLDIRDNLSTTVRYYHPTKRQNRGIFTEVRETGAVQRNAVTVHGNHWMAEYVALTAPAIRRVLRRIRPQEAELIRAEDETIERLRRELEEAHIRRKAAIALAFTRGHVVTLDEVRAAADEQERRAAAPLAQQEEAIG